jgi:glycyl-tRNA synthetase
MVYERENVVGIDASIMMSPKVWQASGHLSGFNDPLVDCLNCRERFRADKAPLVEPGTEQTYLKGGKPKGQKLTAQVGERGYVCPNCQCPELSPERQFNLMFRTDYGPIDPLSGAIEKIAAGSYDAKEIRSMINEAVADSSVYLRPETAQAMFVQFNNVQQTTSQKVPFGIAQIGKSFRNEIITEHFIFRSCEFEQMEMEFFCEPGTQAEWLDYWKDARIDWYKSFANHPERFRLRKHDEDELAHYADNCYDIEFEFPWGWDELEGVASRTDYDLKKHAEASGQKISYFDQQKTNPETGKAGWRYTPYVIEPAAGLTRAVLVYLADAYAEDKGTDHEGKEKSRTLLKLNPKLAPYKAAILPLLRKEGHPEKGEEIARKFRSSGLNVSFDPNQSIGKRYAKHDEIGTPYCITVDGQTMEDSTVTIRDRDTAEQERISIDEALDTVKKRIAES